MNQSDRLRPHPEARFTQQQRFDLRDVARTLSSESSTQDTGHRQKTLYKQGPVTIALFTFERGAGLPGHVARGVVTINVLDGELRVAAAGQEHVLAAGHLLVLASNVPHDVVAAQNATMLLQVHLDEPQQTQ